MRITIGRSECYGTGWVCRQEERPFSSRVELPLRRPMHTLSSSSSSSSFLCLLLLSVFVRDRSARTIASDSRLDGRQHVEDKREKGLYRVFFLLLQPFNATAPIRLLSSCSQQKLLSTLFRYTG